MFIFYLLFSYYDIIHYPTLFPFPRYSSFSAAPKEKRAPSAYNVFMKTEVEKVKKVNPSLKPAEAFKAAALNVSILSFSSSY